MKFDELKQKVFKKNTDKNIDYRFKIYGKIQTTLKACKLFLIQRIVKKIKDLKKDKPDDLSSEQEQSLNVLDSQLKNTKSISTDQLKVLSFFIFKWHFHLMIKSNQDAAGTINQQFQKKLQHLQIDWETIDQDYLKKEEHYVINQFYQAISQLKKFKEIAQFKDKIIGDVQKKIAKNKDKKKKLKIRTQEKEEEQEKGEEKDLKEELETFLEKSKQEMEVEEQKGKEQQKQKKFKKEFNSNRYKQDNQQHSHIKHQANHHREYTNNNRNNNRKDIQNKHTFQKKESKVKIEEGIHPSWAAALERKQEQKQVTFQGQKKKLC